jgi:hypothetical protein
MAVILNASTSSGLVQTADTSGELVLQSNGTTELTVTSTGVTVADNLLFNSGYGSSVVAYGCRAWVSFNAGSGTPVINASGNVSSITDDGVGLFTVNFTTAMPDINYSATASTNGFSSTNTNQYASIRHDGGAPNSGTTLKTTTGVSLCSGDGGTMRDGVDYNVAIFR